MPRKRLHSRDPQFLYRNMHETQNLPGMAGRSRLGLKATKPVTESVTIAPEQTPPVPFHWPGAVADHIDVRVEPGWFPRSGKISRIVWRFGTADSVTVDWELDGVNFDTQTFSANTVELPDQAYAGENIAAIVTAAGGSASGLTAWVYLD